MYADRLLDPYIDSCKSTQQSASFTAAEFWCHVTRYELLDAQLHQRVRLNGIPTGNGLHCGKGPGTPQRMRGILYDRREKRCLMTEVERFRKIGTLTSSCHTGCMGERVES